MQILQENMLTLPQAAKLIPGRSGTGVGVSTVWRWVLTGCRGQRLESCMVGGSRMTSQEAIERFLAAINGTTPAQLPANRQAAIAKAERELSAAGI